ncbi:MAG: type II toxin-antitoxin system VapC family toxin [Alphaproteobacteria bacterium]|nr:type II toxin-antitoxin system VapC family toxin [Alphaproteobacteria bacterium]
MSYLLDTHILLWWLADDSALSSKVRSLISDEENLIFVSAASIWEIVIKKSLGKLKVPDNLGEVLKVSHFKNLPMTLEHVLEIGHLPHHHNDPFDRMLVAQANCSRLTIITADKKLLLYNVLSMKA